MTWSPVGIQKFSPLWIGSPIEMFEPQNVGTCLDAGGAQASDGESVKTVVNASTNGNWQNDGMTIAQPKYDADGGPNGDGALYFSGGQIMYTPDYAGQTAGEIVMVGKLDADPPATGGGALWVVGAGTDYSFIPFVSDGKVYDECMSSGRHNTGVDPGNFANWFAYGVVSTSSEWTAYFNGVQFYTTGTNTFGTPTTNGKFGAHGDTIQWANIRMIGYYRYSAKLSTAERAWLYQYINQKWF